TPTPVSAATAPVPPSASITSSTELSKRIMSRECSQYVNLSTDHRMGIEFGAPVMSHLSMADKLKSLGNRLKMTREALGLSAADLCKRIRIKPNRWSQYESGERRITVDIADRLCDEFDLSLDWIYRGNPAQLPHALRLKMPRAA